jgi:hypothetical protein
MEPSQELIDQLYVEKVMRARRIDPVQKLFAPARLFEYARSVTMAGIRNEHPGASEDRVREIFRERLRLRRRMEGRE